MLKNKLLLVIIALAALLRFYQLGKVPISLNWDETAHGYNAYSILKTAKDEYGYKLPLYFRSFDDYKPPLYTYLVVPSVALFGLNEFAIRFPSAFLGVLAVLFTYLMVLELLKNKKIALLSAFFLAVSPWHIQFSRLAFETNSAIFWSVLGTWSFLKSLTSNRFKAYFLTLSAVAFGANLFMYHNARVFVPLFTIFLIALFKNELLKNKKILIIPAVVSIFFVSVLAPILVSPAGQFRYKGTTIFADKSVLFKTADLLKEDQTNGYGFIGKIFHNRRVVYFPIILENYLSHLKPTFLFFTADMDRHHAPGVGLLYLWDLPFIIIGTFYLIKEKFQKRSKLMLFWWFLIAPVAASVTWGVPHSLRSEIFLPTFQILAAIGVYFFIKHFKNNRVIILITAVSFLLSFFYYLHQYYGHTNKEFSKAWLYGRKEAVIYTESIKNNYDKVIVSTKLEQPHEFWLFYSRYDPKKYQDSGGTVSGGYLEDKNKFDKYYFKPINYETDSEGGKTLFVGTHKELEGKGKELKRINYLNGENALVITESN